MDRLVWGVQKDVVVKDARICMAGRKVGVSTAVEFYFVWTSKIWRLKRVPSSGVIE